MIAVTVSSETRMFILCSGGPDADANDDVRQTTVLRGRRDDSASAQTETLRQRQRKEVRQMVPTPMPIVQHVLCLPRLLLVPVYKGKL